MAYSIGDLNKRVIIVSSHEDVSDGKLLIKREGAYACWASIKDAASYNKDRQGAIFQQPHEKRTHKMCIRYRQDISISVGAWVFEERLKSAPRWYKIIGQKDEGGAGQWWIFDLRLHTESDSEGRPQAPAPDPLFSPVTQ